MTIEFEPGKVYSRPYLAALTGLCDRKVREGIRRLRREGKPIVAVPEGGYKLAETQTEKSMLLAMYLHRAMDELETYNRLRREMQCEGQIQLVEVTE